MSHVRTSEDIDYIYPASGADSLSFDNATNKRSQITKENSVFSDIPSRGSQWSHTERPSTNNRRTDHVFNRQSSYATVGNRSTFFNRETVERNNAIESVRDFIPDRGFVFKLRDVHTGGISALFVHSPSNRITSSPMVITGSEDKSAAIWSLHTGEFIRRLEGGHTKAITSIAVYTPLNPNAPVQIVTAGKDSIAVLWDLNSGRLIHKMRGGHGIYEISSVVVYTPTQTAAAPLIVTGGWDSAAVVWDLITGQQMYRLENGHCNGITAMSLYCSINSDPILITASADETVAIWNLLSSQILRKLEGGHTDRIYSLAVYAPEQSMCAPLIITGGEDLTAVVWDLHSGQQLSKLTGGHTGTITSIAIYSPDDGISSPLILTTSVDKTAILWDLVTGVQVRKLSGCHSSAVQCAAVYSPLHGRGSPLFLTGSMDKTAVIWDLWSSEHVRMLDGGHSKSIKAVAVYTPPNRAAGTPLIVTGSYDKTAVVWDLHAQEAIHRLENGHTGEITALIVYQPRAGNALVITASEDSTIAVWDIFTGQLLRKCKDGHTDWVTALAVFEAADPLTPPLIVSGSYDKTIAIWDLHTGCLKRKLAVEHTAAITSIVVYVPAVDSYATPLLISGSEDKTLIVWDYESGNVVRKLESHNAGVTALLLYAPNETTVQIVSVSYDKTGIVWDLHTGRLLRRLDGGHQEWISSVALYAPSSDPTHPPLVVTASQDKTVVVWELNTGRIIRRLTGVHSKTISSVAVYTPTASNTSPLIITGSYDSTAAVYKNALLPFDFMPLMDEVKRVFFADVESFNSTTTTTTQPWKRIKSIIYRYGEGFWYENHALFSAALVDVKSCGPKNSFFDTFRDDLARVVHLIPLIIQEDSNIPSCILQNAIERKHQLRHLIYDAWHSIIHLHDANYLWQVFHPSIFLRRPALLALADIYPSEFIDFICKLRFIKSHILLYQSCMSYHVDNLSGMVIEGMPSAISVDMWTSVAGYCSNIHNTSAQPVTAYMLPLAAAADMKLLQAYVDVSLYCDDLSIFNSEVGSVAFRYAWRSFGKDAHIAATVYYGIFVGIFTCSVVVFDRLQQSDYLFANIIAWILQLLVLLFIVKYIIDEVQQCYKDYLIRSRRNNERLHSISRSTTTSATTTMDKQGSIGNQYIPGQHRHTYLQTKNTTENFYSLYNVISHNMKYLRNFTIIKIGKIIFRHFSEFWNILDLAVIIMVLLGTLLRCFYTYETNKSRNVLALSCVLVWFKLLYFMRPFKGSGPLITMILRIMSDIKYFLFILAIVLTGFALAFWTISYPNASLPFGTIPSSFIESFLYMLGQDIDAKFTNTSSPQLGVFLVVMFMLFMMILMLNLLIALMGNSFQVIQNKGVAQWRIEQACMMLEQRFSLSEGVIRRHRHFSRIHVMKASALVDKARKEEFEITSRYRSFSMTKETVDTRKHTESLSDINNENSQITIDKKFNNLQETTATQMKLLSINQSAMEKKVNHLTEKLNELIEKLTSSSSSTTTTAATTTATGVQKDSTKLAALLNPFASNTAINDPTTSSSIGPSNSIKDS